MGMSQRRKGLRVEYLVRDRMRELGYECHRVPSSGAAQGFKGDLECRKEGQEFKIEVKGSTTKFKTLYSLYTKYRPGTGTVRFFIHGEGIVAFGPFFEDVRRANEHFPVISADNTPAKDMRGFKFILGLKKLLGESDYLAIKQDNQVILFIKFWSV
jgi:hypothetical protein